MIVNMILIMLASLLGAVLTIGGLILTLISYIYNMGYMFEGGVITVLGIIILLLIMVASSVGKTFMTFNKVLTSQIEMNQTLVDNLIVNKSMKPPGIDSLLSGLMPGNITITDLETGKTTSSNLPGGDDSLQKINDMVAAAMNSGKKKKPLEDMNIQELEKELAKAISDDNYENAEKINKELKKRKE